MTPTLAPTAWTFFAKASVPTKADWLPIINRMVNNGIDPLPGPARLDDIWKIGPSAGFCHDYAVTKREILLHMGYHAGELLLCEVELETPVAMTAKILSGEVKVKSEHHMVLIVNGLVLDNIEKRIVPLAKMRYKVVRQQSVYDPNFWESP